MKILLADDDREYCLSIKRYLQKKNNNYEVSLAFDGRDAKRCVEGDKYDIIFMDCDMPFLSGVDLIRIIKKENPQAKLIMVSGYKGIEDNFAKAAGVDEFLRKPFELRQVDEILDKYECGK
ncbi:MAG: response regulator [Candidatus Omnitrophota bacterium]